MKANEVLKLLNITRPTLTKYVKTGAIKAKLQPNGQYDYDSDSVDLFLHHQITASPRPIPQTRFIIHLFQRQHGCSFSAMSLAITKCFTPWTKTTLVCYNRSQSLIMRERVKHALVNYGAAYDEKFKLFRFNNGSTLQVTDTVGFDVEDKNSYSCCVFDGLTFSKPFLNDTRMKEILDTIGPNSRKSIDLYLSHEERYTERNHMLRLVRQDDLLKDYFDLARVIVEDNPYDQEHRSLFAEIAAHNQHSLIEALMVGVDVNHSRDTDNKTPLHVACEVGTVEAVKLLLDRGADPNAQDMCGMTPLFLCLYDEDGNNLKKAQLLIDHGADVNKASERGDTVLHFLAWRRNEHDKPFIEFLIENGADLLRVNSDGDRPYNIASRNDAEFARLFIQPKIGKLSDPQELVSVLDNKDFVVLRGEDDHSIFIARKNEIQNSSGGVVPHMGCIKCDEQKNVVMMFLRRDESEGKWHYEKASTQDPLIINRVRQIMGIEDGQK